MTSWSPSLGSPTRGIQYTGCIYSSETADLRGARLQFFPAHVTVGIYIPFLLLLLLFFISGFMLILEDYFFILELK